MTDSIVVVGYGLAILSSVFNGLFAAPSRLKRVESTNIHPLVFNWWVSLGVFLSSMVSLPITAGIKSEVFAFPPLGLLAGALLVLAIGASFLAIQRVGLSLGQAVWGGSAVIVSFLWGSLGPDWIGSAPQDVGLSVVGVLMIVLGIVTCVIAGEWSRRKTQRAKEIEITNVQWEKEPLIVPAEPPKQSDSVVMNTIIGLCFALGVGLFGGSILVPTKLLPAEQQQLAFLPAFGVGCLVTCTLVVGIYALATKRVPDLHPRQCAAPGILSGILWNCGNYCSIFAMSSQTPWSLPYAVAYPILQSAVVFSGLIGIVVFKEITGVKPISTFFVGSAIIVGGCVMLGAYGPN